MKIEHLSFRWKQKVIFISTFNIIAIMDFCLVFFLSLIQVKENNIFSDDSILNISVMAKMLLLKCNSSI